MRSRSAIRLTAISRMRCQRPNTRPRPVQLVTAAKAASACLVRQVGLVHLPLVEVSSVPWTHPELPPHCHRPCTPHTVGRRRLRLRCPLLSIMVSIMVSITNRLHPPVPPRRCRHRSQEQCQQAWAHLHGARPQDAGHRLEDERNHWAAARPRQSPMVLRAFRVIHVGLKASRHCRRH